MRGDLFHVCNRGIAKSKIFYDNSDYYRFVYNLYKLNNKDSAIRTLNQKFKPNLPKQNKIVDILKWSLLPNHYHLLLCECVDGGVSQFVNRLGNAYTKYINIRHKRNGYLFQNKAVMVNIENNSQFLYIPMYIDLNPLDLCYPQWRSAGIKNHKKAFEFLNNYTWSSFRDYRGIPNFPVVISQEKFFDLYDTTREEYANELVDWLKEDGKDGKSMPIYVNVAG